MAGERYARGVDTACYVGIGLESTLPQTLFSVEAYL